MQVLKGYRFWSWLAIQAWVREVAGGAPINVGRIRPKPKSTKQASIHKHIGGPKAHHEFEPFDDDHPFTRVFQEPNHYDVAYDLWAYHVIYYLLCGEAHWWTMRNRWGMPRELWVIPTHWMRLRTAWDGRPDAYIVQSPWGTAQEVPYDEVVNFWWHSPLNRFEGYAASLAINEWIDAYEAAVRAQLAQYLNGSIPNFHVQLSDVYGDPDESFLRRFYGKWFSRFQGADRTNLPLITGAGVEVKPLNISPVQMDYQATDTASRDRILAAYGVPKGIIGIDPTADISAYAPQKQFCRFIINPTLHYFSQVITHKVMRPADRDAIAFWDDRVLNDPAQKLQELSTYLQQGVQTINEARTELGKEPYPLGGDNPLIGGSPVPWVKEEKGEEQQGGGGGLADLLGGGGEQKAAYEPHHDAEMERAFRRTLSQHDGTPNGFQQARQDSWQKLGVDPTHAPERLGNLNGRVHGTATATRYSVLDDEDEEQP